MNLSAIAACGPEKKRTTNEFKADRNVAVVDKILKGQGLGKQGVIDLLDDIYTAASCFAMSAKHFPKLALSTDIDDIDVEIMSEVCFQLEAKPRQKNGKFTASIKYGISVVNLHSK